MKKSLFLFFTTLLCLVSIGTNAQNAAKIGTTEYETLAAAVAAVPTDGTQTTITMIADETISGNAGVTIAASQNVVLELNGKVVSSYGPDAETAYLIKNLGTLTIQDNTDTNKNGTGTGKLYSQHTQPSSNYSYATNCITNNGTLVIESGYIQSHTACASYCVDNQTNGNLYTPTTTVNGGHLYNYYTYAIRQFCNSTTNQNTVIVNNGLVEGYGALWMQAANNNVNIAKLEVNGGNFKTTEKAVVEGTKTVSEGSSYMYLQTKNMFADIDFNAGVLDVNVYLYAYTENTTFNVAEGVYNGWINDYYLTYPGASSISGGKFSASINALSAYEDNWYYAPNVISGGIYAAAPTVYNLAEGYDVVANTDDATKEAYPYAVGTAVAQITTGEGESAVTTKYATLQAAVAAAQNGDVVEVLTDITLEGHDANGRVIIDNKTVTLDLGGKTLTGDGCDAVIYAKNGANVTITGNGTIVAKECEDGYAMAVWAKNEGTVVTIENGTFNQIITTDDTQYDMIYASAKATINILGGTFETTKPIWVLNLQDNSNSTISVTGGKFYGFNPSNCISEGEGTNFVATGYAVVQNGNVYTVEKAQETVKAASYVEPTDQAAKAAIDDAINPAKNTNVATTVNEVAEKATVDETATKSYVKVELTKAATEVSGENTVVTSMTFDVNPVYVTVSGTTETENTIANSDIKSPITFRLPVDANVTQTAAEVFHYTTSMGYYPIQGDATSGKYIEISTKSFSEFSYTLSTSECTGTVYAGTSTAIADQTLEQFATTRATYPNAVMIVDEKFADLVQDQTNVIVKYSVGKKGSYYECPKFELTDRASGKTVDFYSPVDFTAVSGSYSRTLYDNSTSWCVPFELSTNDFPATTEIKLLSFAYYEPIYENGEKTTKAYAYFNSRSIIGAGVPFIAYSKVGGAWVKNFDNTLIVAQPENSTVMQGSYVSTNSYKSEGYYGISSTRTQLADFSSASLGAFRSLVCLKYTDEYNGGSNHTNTNAGSPKFLQIGIIGEDGDLTGLDGTPIVNEVPDNATKSIYTIDGKKVSEASAPGIYIVNGKKVIVK